MGDPKHDMDSFYKALFGGMLYSTADRAIVHPDAARLTEAVASQIGVLHDAAPADWHGGEELPDHRDLTTYADAFASARRQCPHDNTTEILYGREWYCDDCRRYLGRHDFPRRRGWL